jgi:transcription termination factor Rho
MFDISALKQMKLAELQEIAKAAKTIKFNGVKKEALISQILELQSAKTDSTSDNKKLETKTEEDKPKRARIVAPEKVAIQKSFNTSLFADEAPPLATASPVMEKEMEQEGKT